MQAFRAAAQVDTDHELHIQQVPFQPGSLVEVIVLPAEAEPSSTGARAAETSESGEERLNGGELVREQYRLAGQYPEDYVILVRDRIVFHSPDRRAAFGAYDQACEDYPAALPVVVEPGGKERRAPVFRGRAFVTRTRSRG